MSQLSESGSGLSIESCHERQHRLVEGLDRWKLAGAVISDRRHVMYFTGFWQASYHTPILYLDVKGWAKLAVPEAVVVKPLCANEIVAYPWQRLGTLIDSPTASAIQALEPQWAHASRIGFDQPLAPMIAANDHIEWVDLSAELVALRRAKYPDEVELIRHAVLGCEAAYAKAAEILAPGVREIDMFAEMQAAAIREIGEPIGEMGNDFQAGTGGGPPRRRGVEAGELMPLDVAVSVRGYRCDLCRTFVVGGQPTGAQRQAAEMVLAALELVEQQARVGTSARWLYEQVQSMLAQNPKWEFPHHLGHGTGLSNHEPPYLNPHWDDSLMPGDLFTVEPGLYGDDLVGGVRIEDNYWIGPDGLMKLSHFPRGLVIPKN